jgi:sterol desaturase/sphingolipid hydroxylase (fatty acid hydroxylase superfamily)
VHTLLKSEVGPYPVPVFPRGIDLRAEDRKARRRLYPVTIVYAVQLSTLMVLAVRSPHSLRALAFLALGAAAWGPLEYLAHRFVLHGVFPRGRGWLRLVLHHLLDASHADHHARPWDGNHINGHLDTLPVAVVAAALGLLAPPYTASAFLAALFACYTAEEWAHHAMHFWSFDSPYFQYIRRRHLWHHSRHGVGRALGITSGVWDVVFGTRVPRQVRTRLRVGRRRGRLADGQALPA